MTAKDAWRFPLVGSAMLFGLYVLFKVFNKDLINLLLTAYFLFLGFFSLVKTLGHLLSPVLPSSNATLFTVPVIPYLFESMYCFVLGVHVGSGLLWLEVLYSSRTDNHWL